MINKRILTAFLGGAIGILIVGYAFYLTGKQYPWLIPIGTLAGCSLGYFISNAKVLMRKAKAISFAVPIQKAKISLQKNKTEFNQWFAKFLVRSRKFFKAIGGVLWWPFRQVALLFKFMFKHPVHRAFTLELLVLMAVFTLYLFGISQIFSIVKNFGLPFALLFVALLIVYGGKAQEVKDNRFYFHKVWKSWKEKSLFLYTIKSIISVVTQIVFWNVFFLVGVPYGFYGVIIMLITGAAIAGVYIVNFYVQVLKYSKNLITFIVTLLCVIVSYFVFYKLFSNQLVIWSVALFTGCLASSLTALVSSRAIKSYIYLNPDRWLKYKTIKFVKYFEKKTKIVYKHTEWFLEKLGTTNDGLRDITRERIVFF